MPPPTNLMARRPSRGAQSSSEPIPTGCSTGSRSMATSSPPPRIYHLEMLFDQAKELDLDQSAFDVFETLTVRASLGRIHPDRAVPRNDGSGQPEPGGCGRGVRDVTPSDKEARNRDRERHRRRNAHPSCVHQNWTHGIHARTVHGPSACHKAAGPVSVTREGRWLGAACPPPPLSTGGQFRRREEPR